MKIGILTYYNVHNHGALLQANALKNVLEQEGHHVVFLTFQRNYSNISSEQAKKYRLSISSIPFYFHYLKQKGISNFLYNLAKRNTLNCYRRNHLFTDGCFEDFDGDIVIIGSDEVFSQEIGINPFFYGHGIPADRIISYAGCFGPTTQTDILQNDTYDLVCSGFNKMSSISVRDENSKNIVSSLGFSNVAIVSDPVFLYGYPLEIHSFTPKHRNYLLIYSYDRNTNNSKEIEQIRFFAHSRGLIIFSVGYHHNWCDKNINVSPTELLGYIKNADFVITDTFHGAALSILCNTQFAAKIRRNTNKLGYLLQEHGLQDRSVADFSELEAVASRQIDFCPVNDLILQRRTESRKFLLDSLK